MKGNSPAPRAKVKAPRAAGSSVDRHAAITDTLSKWRDYQAWVLSMKSRWAKKRD